MFGDDDDLVGRRLERKVVRDRYVDLATGDEFIQQSINDVCRGVDGSIESVDGNEILVLSCGHALAPGHHPIVRCSSCSQASGFPVYVCPNCAITCPVTGAVLCMSCSTLAPDGKRYSAPGLKQAMQRGLFDGSKLSRPRNVFGVNRLTRFLQRLLEWW